jgi:peroxiredoxin family protein
MFWVFYLKKKRLFLCLCIVFRDRFHYVAQADLELYSSASASRMLELQACATMSNLFGFLDSVKDKKNDLTEYCLNNS